MSLPIHSDIVQKLDTFCETRKIPHLIFHGESGCGKRYMVHQFINKIYYHKQSDIKKMVTHVNCAHSKGIKFIREELKFFAKSHINIQGGNVFKSIILFNADKLTIDAQSALRRCIELFSHTTRFFIVIEDKFKLLMPILSRFCEIYVPPPKLKDKTINLYQYQIKTNFNLTTETTKRNEWLKKNILKTFSEIGLFCKNENENENSSTCENKHQVIEGFTTKLYEKGYSALDVYNILENDNKMISKEHEDRKNKILIQFDNVKKEFRNEKLLILYMINLFLSSI